MAYKVKQLADISGVSVRTLHWYDKIDLLKPAYQSDNGTRYYEQEQLLQLQQILFFRELGISLEDIKQVLIQDDFDLIKSLSVHRQVLSEEITRKQNLIQTVDKTIDHLRGEATMKDAQFYNGFDESRQKEYEQYLVKYRGHPVEDQIAQSHKRTAKWGKDEWDTVKQQGDQIHQQLASCIDENLAPESSEVQAIIAAHYQLQSKFFDINKETYIGLTQLYAEHPDFEKFFVKYHVDLIAFIGKAMRHYANENL